MPGTLLKCCGGTVEVSNTLEGTDSRQALLSRGISARGGEGEGIAKILRHPVLFDCDPGSVSLACPPKMTPLRAVPCLLAFPIPPVHGKFTAQHRSAAPQAAHMPGRLRLLWDWPGGSLLQLLGGKPQRGRASSRIPQELWLNSPRIPSRRRTSTPRILFLVAQVDSLFHCMDVVVGLPSRSTRVFLSRETISLGARPTNTTSTRQRADRADASQHSQRPIRPRPKPKVSNTPIPS